jgi:hypothetical protein
MKHHILFTLQGGVAEVCEDTLPAGIIVEILDLDNMAADEQQEMSCWSSELREYWAKNHKSWGQCKDGFPCGTFNSARTECLFR